MKKEHVLFLLIFLFGAFLRLYGLNWDQGMHLHPDERFLTMVTNDVTWPKTITQYFDTNASSLNPHNNNFSFYVYGTWPFIVTKYIAERTGYDTYDGIPTVGRLLAALCDIITLLVVYKMGRTVGKNVLTGLIALFLYATMVLAIQLSHFYTVDPFANLFTSLTLLWILEKKHAVLLATALGIAMSAKISSALLLPIVGLSYAFQFPWRGPTKIVWKRRAAYCVSAIILVVTTILTLRFAYPYLFTNGLILNPKVVANWKELRSFEGVFVMFPPALQWIHTTIALPLLNIAYVGLGIPQTLLFLGSLIYMAKRAIQKTIDTNSILLLGFIALVFLYQGSQFAKPMRYFWSAFPSIAVISSLFAYHVIQHVLQKQHALLFWATTAYIFMIILWSSMFMNMYTKSHTRVEASAWIYTNIPKDSILSWEHWDDPLPLLIDNHTGNEYVTYQLPIFDTETPEKWKKIETFLGKSDYYILSSNRAYGGITNASFRFPQTTYFYELLFSDKLGFTLVAQFTSRPTLPIPFTKTCIDPPMLTYGVIAQQTSICSGGIQIIDDYSDETFTVYDHPKVLIFKKINQEAFLEGMKLIETIRASK